jgi:hypothetical protein
LIFRESLNTQPTYSYLGSMKKKYTKEQLEFYFTKLMQQLKRIPTEEDMEKAKNFPSVTVYTERFGSWKNVKEKLGNLSLNQKTCVNCGKLANYIKQNKQFCSPKCAREFAKKEKLKSIPPKICMMCDTAFTALEVPNFKKRKICTKKECAEKLRIKMDAKKYNKLTPAMKKQLLALKQNKCNFCEFEDILFFITPKKHSDKKLINMLKRNDFSYLLVCPNHKALIEKKKMHI